jgi:hypothetical protein
MLIRYLTDFDKLHVIGYQFCVPAETARHARLEFPTELDQSKAISISSSFICPFPTDRGQRTFDHGSYLSIIPTARGLNSKGQARSPKEQRLNYNPMISNLLKMTLFLNLR